MFYNGNTRGQEVVLRNLVQRGQIVPLPFAPEKGAIMARTRNERLLQELKDRFSESEKKKKINGKLILFVGKSVILELTCEDFCVTVSGAEVQQAQKRPLTEEETARQIRKTGDSFFEFETLTVQMDPDVFLPVQALKELRRTALAQLEELLLSSYRREEKPEETGGCRQKARNLCDASEKEGTETSAPDIWVCVETQEQLSAALDFPEISGVYLDAGMYQGKDAFLRKGARDLAACRRKDRHCFLALPWIWREDGRTALFEDAEVVSLLRKFDGMLIRNAEEAEYLLRLDYRGDRRTDANVYRWNRWSEKFWGGQGFPVGTFPLELTARELKESGARDTELIVYGAMPLMISAQCLKKNISGCDGIPAVLELQDRKRQRFRVKTHCAYCYTVLYNSVPTDLAGDAQLVRETGANRVRIQLTTENAEESRKVIAREIRAFSCGETVDLSGESFTRGHLKRKVE